MGCAYVTHLRLTNSRIYVFYAEMNHFEAHLIAKFHQKKQIPKYSGSTRPFSLSILYDKIQNDKCIVKNFRWFFSLV